MLVAVDDAEITKRWLCMRIGILARVIQKLPAFVTPADVTLPTASVADSEEWGKDGFDMLKNIFSPAAQ